MRVFGVDFTSVPGRRKPITVAVCALEGDLVSFERIVAIESFAAFQVWLKADGPWVAGFDFPFGQSRTFLRNMNWPAPWAAYVEQVGGMSRAGFRAALEAYKAPRAPGDKEHSRSFERGTGAASPQKLYGVPVALMFFEGVPRLLRAGLHFPGLHAGDSSRIALEAYPGMAARALHGSNVSYKNDQKKKQTASQMAARRAILGALTGAKGRSRFGLTVAAPNHLAEDPTGDHLDAPIRGRFAKNSKIYHSSIISPLLVNQDERGRSMVARAYTVAFEGVNARIVEVQCAVTTGMPNFTIVGLPDKAVSEAKERVRAALTAMAIALPSKRITVNLSPADLPKEGSHFDLPVALALLAALDIIPREDVEATVALGELSLDGRLIPVVGALPAAMAAAEEQRQLLCPLACGAEAAWVGATPVIAAATLTDVIRHFTGQQPITPALPGEVHADTSRRDLRDVKGQERAKRALEIAAAGRHHLLMVGSPGSGKSMLAARMPGILPPLSAVEALETSMVHSLSGLLTEGGISRSRPFREPHHTASMAAIVGGGRGAKPGEISLAHNGVLFMDEFPEFPRTVLETLRQPMETGEVVVARANAHIRYPCRFLLVAAANPCKCGYLADPARACARVPLCGEDYLGRISGPLMDRFDLRVEVPPVAYSDLDLPQECDSSATVAARVAAARAAQTVRFADHPEARVNADAEGALLEEIATPDTEGRDLLIRVAERFGLTARGYHRVLRVARTIADLAGEAEVRKPHVAEAVSYRLVGQRES